MTNGQRGLVLKDSKFDTSKLREVPILEVARRLGIALRNKKTFCFGGHDHKTPSLSFDDRKNYWHCFGCGLGGDTISLVSKYLGLDFKAACEWLEDRFGIGQSQKFRFPENPRRLVQIRRKGMLEDRTVSNVADPEVYTWLINSCSLTAKGYRYLTIERGFKKSTVEHFNIKDISNPAMVFSQAKTRWGVDRILKCGLAKDTNGLRRFIWWDHTILFPFYGLNDDVVYLQGRRIAGEPKYVNLRGLQTEVFNLRALRGLAKGSPIYICEGITDVFSATEGGLTAVGILGAHSFRDEWVSMFLEYNVTVIPDADSAGKQFFTKIKQALRGFGKSVAKVELKQGQDLTDFWRSRGSKT